MSISSPGGYGSQPPAITMNQTNNQPYAPTNQTLSIITAGRDVNGSTGVYQPNTTYQPPAPAPAPYAPPVGGGGYGPQPIPVQGPYSGPYSGPVPTSPSGLPPWSSGPISQPTVPQVPIPTQTLPTAPISATPGFGNGSGAPQVQVLPPLYVPQSQAPQALAALNGLAAGGAAASKGVSKFLFGAGAAGKGASKLLIGAAGGIVFALVAGIAGVLFGVRRYWGTAIDEQEKRQLAWFAVSGIGVVFLFTGLMGWAAHLDSMAWATAAFFALIIAIGAMNLTWMPHILRRRHAQEAAISRVAAAMARREERKQAWMGIVLGLLFGGIGLAAASWMLGTQV